MFELYDVYYLFVDYEKEKKFYEIVVIKSIKKV